MFHNRGTTNDEMPKERDALSYLRNVQSSYPNRPSVYNTFLDIMKDFKSQRIDTDGVINRVKVLFKDNHSLILGFNQFLPPGYKIELDNIINPSTNITKNNLNGTATQQIDEDHAVQYVVKIKHRFRNNPEIYAKFLNILHEYQVNRTVSDVYNRIEKLFHNNLDLLEEFKYFLPDTSNIKVNNTKKTKKKL